jgi:hypothetical protein
VFARQTFCRVDPPSLCDFRHYYSFQAILIAIAYVPSSHNEAQPSLSARPGAHIRGHVRVLARARRATRHAKLTWSPRVRLLHHFQPTRVRLFVQSDAVEVVPALGLDRFSCAAHEFSRHCPRRPATLTSLFSSYHSIFPQRSSTA